MSTRRTTRAGSRAASNTGASPAPTNLSDIPAPPPLTPSARRRRAANTGLPAVGVRTSTAYGSAGVVRPARSTPAGSEQINDVLSGLLQPADPNSPSIITGRATRADSRVSSRRQVTTTDETPGATPVGQTSAQGAAQGDFNSTPSFNNESGIFGNATIESSIADNDLTNILEEPEPNDLDSEDDFAFPRKETSPGSIASKRLEEIARQNTRHNAGQTPTPAVSQIPGNIPNAGIWGAGGQNPISGVNLESLGDNVSTFAKKIWNYRHLNWALFSLGVILFSVLLLLTTPDNLSWHGPFDLRNNIGQFIPSRVAHPFLPDDVLSIRKRLSSIESDIIMIKKDLKGVDFKAIHRLEELLPDFLVVKKKNGQRQIPDDFWHALQHKIRSDETLRPEPAASGGQSKTDGVNENKVRKIVGDEWAKYLSENDAKLGKISNEDFVRKFPQMLQENDVVSKSDIIDMISQNWDENSSKIMSEMSLFNKQLERATRDITKLQQRHTKFSKDDIKALAQDVLKLLPDAQLKAAANANLQNNVNWGLTKVNHFAKLTGAVVVPHLTSPAYIPPDQNLGLHQRLMRQVMRNPIPVPAPADEALVRWEEHGDCWCSPSVDSKTGYGPSLGVLMGNSIYPEQVVIEHISTSATLQPGSAPREMDLLAFIPDAETFKAAQSLSVDLFQDEAVEQTGKLSNYVRIAAWTYDAESDQNVQSFAVQLDLKSLGAHTSRLVMRSKNNWGGEKVPYTCLYRVRVHGEAVTSMGQE